MNEGGTDPASKDLKVREGRREGERAREDVHL